MEARSSAVELYGTVFDALDRGAVVVTANQRAARTLRLAFDRHKLGLGLKSWTPAIVLAWESWTVDLWQRLIVEGHAAELLLNRTQEHFVWRSIIQNDPDRHGALRSTDSLAELATEAWTLLNRYNGIDQLREYATSTETRTFLKWVNGFERRCRDQQWLSLSKIESALSRQKEAMAQILPAEIILTSFDEMYPSRARMIAAIRETGRNVEEVSFRREPEECLLVEAVSERDEIAAAARYLKARLQQSPNDTFAFIVPDLQNKRAAIDRCFRRILSPELENIGARDNIEPYEFSIGTKLSDTPFVRTAMDLLHWVDSSLPMDRVSKLLLSPFWAGEAEIIARATFDAMDLRRSRLLRPDVTIGWMIELSSRSRRSQQFPNLINGLKALKHTAAKHNVSSSLQTCTEWSDIIRDLLHQARWGTTGNADSVEHQTMQRWETVLDELSTLSFDDTHMTFSRMLDALKWIVERTIFAPESRDAPVQILGPLEASGSVFNALWFAGAGDLTWPPHTTNNPLLPWALKKELGIKGANTQTDDDANRRIVERINSSASSVVFSYAGRLDDANQRPSSIIAQLSLHKVAIESIAPSQNVATPVLLEEIVEVPLPPLPDQETSGGVNIFSLQAACGFRAFAEKRIAATEPETLDLGMNARERGNVIHRTMQFFWDEVHSQSALKAMSEEQRDELLDRAIDHGLVQFLRVNKSSWDAAFVEVQAKRLKTLLRSWLAIENNRPPFDVLYSEQEFRDVTVGPLRIKVRLDRVDETPSGDILIDYKTGKANPSSWMGSRPDAPQLPLYAVLASSLHPNRQVAEVAFANIYAGKDAAFEGYLSKITASTTKSHRPGLTIAEQIEQWRIVLEDLAKQFYRGEVSVNPKQYPQTCKYCSQRTLCRLNPDLLNMDEDLDETTEDIIGDW